MWYQYSIQGKDAKLRKIRQDSKITYPLEKRNGNKKLSAKKLNSPTEEILFSPKKTPQCPSYNELQAGQPRGDIYSTSVNEYETISAGAMPYSTNLENMNFPYYYLPSSAVNLSIPNCVMESSHVFPSVDEATPKEDYCSADLSIQFQSIQEMMHAEASQVFQPSSSSVSGALDILGMHLSTDEKSNRNCIDGSVETPTDITNYDASLLEMKPLLAKYIPYLSSSINSYQKAQLKSNSISPNRPPLGNEWVNSIQDRTLQVMPEEDKDKGNLSKERNPRLASSSSSSQYDGKLHSEFANLRVCSNEENLCSCNENVIADHNWCLPTSEVKCGSLSASTANSPKRQRAKLKSNAQQNGFRKKSKSLPCMSTLGYREESPLDCSATLHCNDHSNICPERRISSNVEGSKHFRIVQQPEDHQRKSYSGKKENRYLSPCPIVIEAFDPSSIMDGIVSVTLANEDGQELKSIGQDRSSDYLHGDLVQHLDRDKRASFFLKCPLTSRGRNFRLIFDINFRKFPNGEKDLAHHENSSGDTNTERLISSPFKVTSNKKKCPNEKPTLTAINPSRLPWDQSTEVWIKGINFRAPVTVQFGHMEAKVIEVFENLVVCLSPKWSAPLDSNDHQKNTCTSSRDHSNNYSAGSSSSDSSSDGANGDNSGNGASKESPTEYSVKVKVANLQRSGTLEQSMETLTFVYEVVPSLSRSAKETYEKVASARNELCSLDILQAD